MPTISAMPGETKGITVAIAISGNAIRAARVARFAALHSERQAGDDLIPFSDELALSLASIMGGQTAARPGARLARIGRCITRDIPYAALQLAPGENPKVRRASHQSHARYHPPLGAVVALALAGWHSAHQLSAKFPLTLPEKSQKSDRRGRTEHLIR